MFVAHTRTHKTQEIGIALAVAGKRQEYRREHELRMRAQKANKSGHEYQCKRTIEYTTFLPSNLKANINRDRQKEITMSQGKLREKTRMSQVHSNNRFPITQWVSAFRDMLFNSGFRT